MTEYPDDADGHVLAELAANDVDMTQPLPIEFHVAVPNEASAQSTLEALTKAGYDAQIEFDEGEPDEDDEFDPDDEEMGPSWTVYVSRPMVPDYDEIVRIQEELSRLASPFEGFADGWGVMIDDEEDEDEA